MHNHHLNSLALFTAILGTSTLLHAANPYSVFDIGNLGNHSALATGINNAGQVVGTSAKPLSYVQGYLYTPGSGMVTIGSLKSTTSSAAAVNDSGVVVGSSAQAPDAYGVKTVAVAYQNGTLTSLGDLGGASAATAINSSGQIVGYSGITGGQDAVLFSGNTPTDLGTLTGSGYSDATAISNNGYITGYSTSSVPNASAGSPNYYHAFLTTAAAANLSTATDLGVSTGYVQSYGSAVNNSGEVVGYESTAAYVNQAFFYTAAGGIQPMGFLPGTTSSTANAINTSGEIVGTSGKLGFLYLNGTMINLNSLINPALGYTITAAVGINDLGQIAVDATLAGDSGDNHALVLSPLLLGDANEDGKVDLNDLSVVLNHLGETDSNWTDGNFDGAATIDLTDLNDVLNNLGTSTQINGVAGSPAPAPEPASLSLLALGALFLIRRRNH